MKKTITGYIMILALLATFLPESSAQKAVKKDEQFNEMLNLVESGSYVFDVQTIQPTGGKTIRPTTMYQMTVQEGLFEADLPYFGRAYQASYGGDDLGVAFSGSPEDLKLEKNEKRRTILLSFSMQGKNDKYEISFSIGHSGYGTLTVTSIKRQPISYYGLISPLEE